MNKNHTGVSDIHRFLEKIDTIDNCFLVNPLFAIHYQGLYVYFLHMSFVLYEKQLSGICC